jgi:hypothetical protein
VPAKLSKPAGAPRIALISWEHSADRVASRA